MMAELRAYRVTWDKYPSIISIYGAKTSGRAKNSCIAKIRDAGYHPRWTELKALRQHSYDNDAVANGLPGLIGGWEL